MTTIAERHASQVHAIRFSSPVAKSTGQNLAQSRDLAARPGLARERVSLALLCTLRRFHLILACKLFDYIFQRHK